MDSEKWDKSVLFDVKNFGTNTCKNGTVLEKTGWMSVSLNPLDSFSFNNGLLLMWASATKSIFCLMIEN